MNDILIKTHPDPRNPQNEKSYTDYDMLGTMRTETIYRPHFVNGNLRGFRNFQDQDAEKKIRSIFESVQTAELLAHVDRDSLTLMLIDGVLHFPCPKDPTRLFKMYAKHIFPFTTMIWINLLLRRDGGTKWETLRLDTPRDEYLRFYTAVRFRNIEATIQNFCRASN